MNAKYFFSATFLIFCFFFFFFALTMNGQTQAEINYDNTSFTTQTIDVEQTPIVHTLENQTNTTTIRTNTILNNTTETTTNTYVFYFNHKQFLKPVYRKSAYC